MTETHLGNDLILYHEGPSEVKQIRVMDLKLCYNTLKFKEGEILTQTFTRYKALMNELVNYGINLSKLEINTGFINGLRKKWLSFCQSLRNINHVKDYELASLFGKLKFEENLIDSIYETEKNKSFVFTTPLLTAFISTSIVQDFQDSSDVEEDTDAKLRPTKDFEAKYNKVKAKLAFLSSSASASKAVTIKNKGIIAEAYEWDEEEVSLDNNEMVEVKVLMELAEENDAISKEDTINGEWVKVSMRKLNNPLLKKKRILGADQLTEDPSRFILPNHDTGRILLAESQRNTIDPSVTVTDSSATDYDLVDESSVCSTPLPPLKKLDGAKPISGPKTIKSILRLKSTFKAETLKGCDIRMPIWYLDSGCTRHITGVKSYLHKYVNQPGPKVVLGDDPTCTTEGYGSIKCNGIVFIKVAFVNGLKYNLISISQLCDAKYIVQFDEKIGTIFNSNKEVVMIAPRVRDVYVLEMTTSAQESCFFAKASENLNWLWHKRLAHLKFKTVNKLAKQNFIIGLPSLAYSKDKPCSSCEKGKHHRASFKTKQTSSIKKYLHLLHMDLFRPITPRSINHEKYTLVIFEDYSRNNILVNFCDEKGISQNFSSPYTPEQNGVAERKNRTLIEAARTMLSGYVFSKQYWTEAAATACYTQNRSTIVKRHLKTPYEIFCKRIPNISFLYVFKCPVYIHNHKDHLGKFNEKADDGYLLRYSLVSKAFRVFNTRRQQVEETYHITFNESPDAIKFSKSSVDNINIAETERYPPDEYLHPYEPSQRYQTNINDVSFIEPYEYPEPVVLETKVSSDQNGQTDQINHNDQNDQSVQNDEILNDDHSEHSNHTNDEQIIDNLPNTKDNQISEHLSYPDVEDTLVQDTIPIPPYCFNLKGYSDSDYAGCNMDRKSTSSACQLLEGKLVCWRAKKQQSVAMSLDKAEYVAAVGCCANILWMKSQLTNYDIIYEKVPIFCDNTIAITISNNPVLYSRTKHIDIRFHFIRDHVLKGDIELHFIPTQYQLVDIFTKPLDEPTFKRLIIKLGMLNINLKPEASALPEEN
ncbi:retrovirus-related pol polyprotein from transposon TNT 1-94 [Tanacetum coccineum]|uniref:Retrovirus-related pol polyprotein from transposon TNT 1-94 n=1 Tax=Tanacetum coccineum TaxID=301880 RepID=A0ABQ4Z9J2_9ASTR